jgi:hypothetical protein
MPHTRILDHEDVRRRYAAGERQSDIARSYGVTDAAVSHVIHRYKPCLEGCGRDVFEDPDRSGVCIDCASRARTLAPCLRGHDFERMQWRERAGGKLHRVCLDCERELKRAARRRASGPCADCGEPCLGRDKRYGPGPSRCRSCNQKHLNQGVAA